MSSALSGCAGAAAEPAAAIAPLAGAPTVAATAPSSVPASPSSRPLPVPTLRPARPVLTASAPMPMPQLTSALTRQLSAAILRIKDKDHFPGVQVVIRYAGGWTWTAKAGFSNLGARVTVTPATEFNAGSITKTFVAALTLQLADEGVLGLDDPLSRWLPGLAYAPDVTIRELLNHTSGIDDAFNHDALLNAIDGRPRTAWAPDRVLAYVKKPYFAAGEGWAYSNTNYLLLGRVIELATGRSVASLLRERFFAPLGMTHTYLESEERPSGTLAHGYDFTGYRWNVRDRSDGTAYLPYTSLGTAIGTAGSLVTTAGDLATWAEALYGGRVLSPVAFAQMIDFTVTAPFHPKWPYGLGVMRISLNGHGSWGHSGTLSGFRAAMRYFPSGRLTIVVMTNVNGYPPDDITKALLAVLYPPAS